MSPKGGTTSQMESVRLKINEHMTSVGEEILCVLDRHQRGDDFGSVTLNVRGFVLEHLSALGEFICSLFQREMETLETLLEKQNKLLDVMLQPRIKLHRAGQCVESSLQVKISPPATDISIKQEPEDHLKQEPEDHLKQEPEDHIDLNILHLPVFSLDSLNLPVCKEVVSSEEERSPSLVQEEPEPTHFKDEQEELLQRPEAVDRPMLALLAVKSEGDDGENRETEPVASTSTEHMETQADVEDCGTSQPTSDDHLLSSHCSESDITEDSDEWEPSVDQSPLNTLKSHKTQHVEGQRLSLSTKISQDLNPSKETHSMQSHTGKTRFSCAICGKMFNRKDNLKTHMRTHTGEKPFTCSVCRKGFRLLHHLKIHMTTHTGEKPFTCSVCRKGFSQMSYLKKHMMTHTGDKPFTCSRCSKGFRYKGTLKQHMMTHTGEKPFTCTVCSKGLRDNSMLKRHMMTHTGEKPFTCKVCSKAFCQLRTLKKHMSTHTARGNI